MEAGYEAETANAHATDENERETTQANEVTTVRAQRTTGPALNRNPPARVDDVNTEVRGRFHGAGGRAWRRG